MKKSKVLFVSRDSGKSLQMRALLQQHPSIDLTFEPTGASALERLQGDSFDFLILYTEKVSLRHFNLIEEVRLKGHTFQILIFADEVSAAVSLLVEKLYGVMIFSVAHMNMGRDLDGLISRFIANEKTFHRVSIRHSTQQKVKVENLTAALAFEACALDLSTTGAQIEISKGRVRLGDRVRLTITLEKVMKTHIVSGKVVWIRINPQGVKTAGIHFMGPREIKRS